MRLLMLALIIPETSTSVSLLLGLYWHISKTAQELAKKKKKNLNKQNKTSNIISNYNLCNLHNRPHQINILIPVASCDSPNKGQRGLSLPQHLCPSGRGLQRPVAAPPARHGLDPRWGFHCRVCLEAAVRRTLHQQLHKHHCCEHGVSIR